MNRNKYIYGMADACFVAQSAVGTKSGTWAGAEEELKNPNRNPVYVYMPEHPSEGCVDLSKKGAIAWDTEKSVAQNLDNKGYGQDDFFEGYSVTATETNDNLTDQRQTEKQDSGKVVEKLNDTISLYTGFITELKWLVSSPRKEADVKQRLARRLDLVNAQIKHWLDKAQTEGIVLRKEYPKGKKSVVMLQLSQEKN